MSTINNEVIVGESAAILKAKVLAAITAGKQPVNAPFATPNAHGTKFYQEVAESTGNAITNYDLLVGESPTILKSKLDTAETGGFSAYQAIFTSPGPHGLVYYQAVIEGTVAEGGGGTGPQGPAGPTGATGATGPMGPSGLSHSIWNYKAKTGHTAGDPGDNYLAWNNATQTAATALLISHIDNSGIDVDYFLDDVKPGQEFRLQDKDVATSWQDWTVNGLVTASATWDTIPIVFRSASGAGSTGFSNNHNLLIITNKDAALKGVVNVWTKNNSVKFAALADGATINTDASLSNNFFVELTNATALLANPSNLTDGMVLNWVIKQGTGGSKLLTFGTKFKFLGGNTTVSTTAGNYDLLSGIYHAASDVIICNLAIGAA